MEERIVSPGTGKGGRTAIFQVVLLCLLFSAVVFPPVASAETSKPVTILPLDARNQTYDYVGYITRICGYTPNLPPRKMMGNINPEDVTYKKQWNIWFWLMKTLDARCPLLILSADSFVYGGLIESRQSPLSLEDALNNVKLLRTVRKKFPKLVIQVFTSIPRKEAQHRERNLAVNLALLALVKEKIIDFLSVSSDDATDIANQVQEISLMQEYVESEGIGPKVILPDIDRIRLGIDESAMVLFIRWLNSRRPQKFRVCPEFRDIAAARVTIDHYSATPVMSVALDMVEVLGAQLVYEPDEADLVLAVNHPADASSQVPFIESLGQLVKIKPVAVAEFSSRQDGASFFQALYQQGLFHYLAGYAAWGMGTNSVGTALCEGIASLLCPNRESYAARTAFLYERMASDYIYLDRIHLRLAGEENIPAYSLETMAPEKENEAVRVAGMEIGQCLTELGISYSVSMLKGNSATEPLCHSFTVELPPNPYGAKTARITIGPFSFPFHRLFEVQIPASAVIND